jgi:hypothetical protein
MEIPSDPACFQLAIPHASQLHAHTTSGPTKRQLLGE